MLAILGSARTGSVLSNEENSNESPTMRMPSVQERPISLQLKDLNNDLAEQDRQMFLILNNNNNHNTTDEESMMPSLNKQTKIDASGSI